MILKVKIQKRICSMEITEKFLWLVWLFQKKFCECVDFAGDHWITYLYLNNVTEWYLLTYNYFTLRFDEFNWSVNYVPSENTCTLDQDGTIFLHKVSGVFIEK